MRCITCNKSFSTQFGYDRHINRIIKCKSKIEQELHIHIICKYCGNQFSGQSALSRHIHNNCTKSPHVNPEIAAKFEKGITILGIHITGNELSTIKIHSASKTPLLLSKFSQLQSGLGYERTANINMSDIIAIYLLEPIPAFTKFIKLIYLSSGNQNIAQITNSKVAIIYDDLAVNYNSVAEQIPKIYAGAIKLYFKLFNKCKSTLSQFFIEIHEKFEFELYSTLLTETAYCTEKKKLHNEYDEHTESRFLELIAHGDDFLIGTKKENDSDSDDDSNNKSKNIPRYNPYLTQKQDWLKIHTKYVTEYREFTKKRTDYITALQNVIAVFLKSHSSINKSHIKLHEETFAAIINAIN